MEYRLQNVYYHMVGRAYLHYIPYSLTQPHYFGSISELQITAART